MYYTGSNVATRTVRLDEEAEAALQQIRDATGLPIPAAESRGSRTIFTVDRNDFETYRVRRGHRHYPIDVLP